MVILTKWVCYDGKVGVTSNGEYYEISTGKKLNKEYYAGAISFRSIGSNKRYSYKKCNKTKIQKEIEILQTPF